MNHKKLNIAFYVPSLEGGIGRVTTLLASGLQKKSNNVEIWTASMNGKIDKKIKKKIIIKYIGKGSVSSSFLHLLDELRINTPTNIISASYHANCIALIASIFSRSPSKFIIVDHPSLGPSLKELSLIKRIVWRMLIFILYPIADKHVAVSKGVSQAMSKYGNVKLSKISVIPNPVINNEIYSKSLIFKNHSFFSSKEPIIIFVGRLSYEKDVGNLLEAFSKVQKKVSSKLLIVGDGPDRVKLEKIVDELNIKNKVSFLGFQSNPYPYFIKSDLLVLSSTREGLPTVLIEALALDLKIVSTDCPSGPREILNNGLYGKLVKMQDSSELANAIVLSLKSKNPVIPKSILDQYKVEKVVNLYTKLLNS